MGDDDAVRAINGTLYLQNVAETETGNYTCHADNMAASRQRAVAIVVSVPPKISLPPLSSRVTEGDEAVFECRVSGTPFPVTVITWTYEDRPLKDTVDSERVSANVETGRLRISNVQLTDEGNYACTVLTTGHPAVVSPNARLYVEKQLKFKPVPVNTKLELGSSGRVACRADGRTPPSVRWVKDGQQTLPDHVTQNSDGSLSFGTVDGGDAGQYMCIANNEQGVINATIRIDVVVKPRFKVKPTNTTAHEGSFVVMHCLAIGDPTPTVQWDKNSRVDILDSSRFRVLANGSISISEVFAEDSGKYGCTAGNNGGFAREEAYLHVTSDGSDDVGDQSADGGGGASNDVTNTIVIAVCSVVAYLAIVVGLTVYCSLRLVRRKNRRKRTLAAAAAAAAGDDKLGGGNGTAVVAAGGGPTEDTELMNRETSAVKAYDPETRSASSSNPSHSTVTPQSVGSGSASQQSRVYEKLSFMRHQLQTLVVLGKGQFGDVFVAKAFSIQTGISDTLVMVKSLLSRDELSQADFYHEMELYCRLNHENVVRLLGLSREAFPVFAIYEYCDWGNLKHFLMSIGDPTMVVQRRPSTAQRMSICRQVAAGMSHIASMRLCHGDLAARNVVVSSSLDVKISNIGLCVDIFAREYVVHRRRPVPLRWMPPESLTSSATTAGPAEARSGCTSLAADVWAFGVVVWELFTPGCPLPMADRSDAEVLAGLETTFHRAGGCSGLQNSLLLGRPVACPDEMWNIAARCMSVSPAARPTFAQILGDMDEMNLLDDSQV
jgi:PTK7 protein tyrosine kinase 7